MYKLTDMFVLILLIFAVFYLSLIQHYIKCLQFFMYYQYIDYPDTQKHGIFSDFAHLYTLDTVDRQYAASSTRKRSVGLVVYGVTR